MEPKYSLRADDGSIIINYDRYKRDIKGLHKAFWQVAFELGYEETQKMTLDEFLEAYAALCVLSEDMRNNSKGGGKD